jgi:peptide/nickel transport system ATP-binding protein
MAMLFVSHDLGVVRRVCDRVLVMRDGRVVEEGAAEDVFTRPRSPYTRDLLAAVPRLEGTRLEGTRLEGTRLEGTGPGGTGASVTPAARSASGVPASG